MLPLHQTVIQSGRCQSEKLYLYSKCNRYSACHCLFYKHLYGNESETENYGSENIYSLKKILWHAMADGIFELLKKSTTGIEIMLVGKTGIRSDQIQLDLF